MTVTLRRAALVPAVLAVAYTAHAAPLAEAAPAVQVAGPLGVALVVVLIVWLVRRDRSGDAAQMEAGEAFLAERESEQVESGGVR